MGCCLILLCCACQSLLSVQYRQEAFLFVTHRYRVYIEKLVFFIPIFWQRLFVGVVMNPKGV